MWLSVMMTSFIAARVWALPSRQPQASPSTVAEAVRYSNLLAGDLGFRVEGLGLRGLRALWGATRVCVGFKGQGTCDTPKPKTVIFLNSASNTKLPNEVPGSLRC